MTWKWSLQAGSGGVMPRSDEGTKPNLRYYFEEVMPPAAFDLVIGSGG